MYRLVLIAAILLATPAHAAVKFATGFEYGEEPRTTAGVSTLFDTWSGSNISVVSAGDKFCDYESSNVGAVCTTNSDCNDGGENAFASCMAYTDNDFELQISPSASTDYVEIGTTFLGGSGVEEVNIHFALTVSALPASGTYRLMTLTGPIGTEYYGAIQLTVLSASTYQLDYYPLDSQVSQDPVHNECSGGTNPGIRCESCEEDADCGGSNVCYNTGPDKGACSNECTSNSPGEQWCLPAQVASVGPLTTNARYEVMAHYDAGVAAGATYASYALYLGGYERSSVTKNVGYCVSTTTQSCEVDATCSAIVPADTCTSAQGNTGTIRFGQNSSATGWTVKIDDILVDDADTAEIATLRVQDLTPNNDGGSNATWAVNTGTCSPESNCIDELNTTPGPDDATTSLVAAAGGTDTDRYTLSDVTAGANDYATTPVLALSSYALMRDESGGGTHPGNDQMCTTVVVTSGGTEPTAGAGETKLEVSNEMEAETTDYIPCGFGIVDDADYNTTTLVNGAYLNVTADKASCDSGSCGTLGTAAGMEVFIRQNAGVLPGKAADVNEDGTITLCAVGDSTVDQTAFHGQMLSRLNDFGSVLFCTRGGSTLADIESVIQNLLDGTESGGAMRCQWKKGSPQPCDYMLLVSGINTLVSRYGLTPQSYCTAGTSLGEPCVDETDCAGNEDCAVYANGYCRGGANHGMPCDCPAPKPLQADAEYCVNKKDSSNVWLDPDVGASCRTCTDNSDCDTGIPCTTNSDCETFICDDPGATDGTCAGASCTCQVGCSSGQCAVEYETDAFTDGSTIRPPAGEWHLSGCPDTTDCPSGLCWASNTVAEAQRSFDAIVAEVTSRSGTGASCATDCKVELVVGVQPRAQNWPRRCVGGTYADQRCSADADCGAGETCKTWAGFGQWGFAANGQRHDSLESYFLQRAKEMGAMFVDIDRYFAVNCDDGGTDCLADAVHWDSDGYEAVGVAVENCFEQIYSTADGYCNDNGTPGDGVRDGTCEERAEDGATGALGDPCDTDDDCALYQCDLLNPDWKGAMAGLWGADVYCVGGTNPFDDCGDNNDCFGGTCTGSYLGDRSGRSGTLTTTGTVSNTSPSTQGLGTGHFNFLDGSAADPGYLNCTAANCPALAISAGKSVTWGGWFKFSSNIATNAVMVRNASTNGFQLRVLNGTTSTPDVTCEVRLGTSTLQTDNITGTTWTDTDWNHLACVFDNDANTVTAYLNGVASGSPTATTGDFTSTQATLTINSTSSTTDWNGAADEVFVVYKALDAPRIARIVSGSIPGDFVDCDSFSAALYAGCDTNADCDTDSGTYCDTGATAIDDDFCTADTVSSKAGCCIGYNAARAGGAAMSACNAIP